MINFRKHFNGGLNADDNFEFILPGQWVNASGVRTFSTDSGSTENIEAIGGTAILYSNLPAGTNLCNGGCADDSGNRLFFLNWNSNGDHGIYCYDKTANIGYKVLLDSQVEDGLNFDKYHYTHSVVFIDGHLVITDNFNEPRYVNVEAGLKLNQPFYSTTETPYIVPAKIKLIKAPPTYRLTLVQRTDGSFANNYTYNNAYQFRYQYVYKDNQRSALSTYSRAIPFNIKADTYNAIDVSLQSTEIIEDRVKEIIVWVKNLSTGKTYEAKRFDKGNPTDSAAIASHNLGATQLTFRFYDNVPLIILDAVQDVTAFDNVPQKSEALEAAKNRLFFGNNLAGYDSPKVTSISATLTTRDPGSEIVTGVWWTIDWIDRLGQDQQTFALYIENITPKGYYIYTGVGATPLSVNIAELDFKGATITNRVIGGPGTIVGSTETGPYDVEVVGATLPSINGATYLKSGSARSLSIVFYDRYRRKCGVVDVPYKIEVPERPYADIAFYNSIIWALSNANALNEIPDWTYYYQVVITKNLTTRFFMQARASSIRYAGKAAGIYDFTSTTYSYTNTIGIGVNASLLPTYSMGYTFTEGDLLKLYIDPSSFYILRVIGQDGDWIVCEPKSIGTLDVSTNAFFEVYTPYRAAEKEVYYEASDMMPVVNPTSNTRQYGITSGVIDGDIYILRRDWSGSDFYNTENMSPLDQKWKEWHGSFGWPNIVDTIGQVRLKEEVRFSDVFILGTKVNNLNKFQPLNTETLSEEDGEIKKLQIANKVQTDGTIMLAICENETVSMYLGETELFDSQGSANVVKTNGVIGSSKALQGSLGTYNPESVFEYNGQIFWYDQRNGCYVRYGNNGLFPISKNKFTRPANLFSKKFKSLSVAEIEALGSRPLVIGGFDPYHKEVLFSIPSTEAPPKGYLPDYPNLIYPYDIYDGQGKTLIYNSVADVWTSSMPIECEKFIRMGNDLYGFKDGALYIFNQPSPMLLFGEQYPSRLMFSNNPGGVHTFHTLGLECNKRPSFVHIRTENPWVQSSDLVYSDFVNKEGIKYAPVLRDRLSPNATGSYVQKQMKGDKIFGKAMLVMLEFEFLAATPFDGSFDGTYEGITEGLTIGVFDNTFDGTFNRIYKNIANSALKLNLTFSDVGHIVNKGHLLNK